MTALVIVTYLSAVAHPMVDSIRWLIAGPRDLEGGASSHHTFLLFRWDVFPLFEGLDNPMVPVYVPTMIFCVVCSAMDRSEAFRINVLAGIATFSLYVIEDIGGDGSTVIKNLLLLAIVGAVLWKLFGDQLREYFQR